MDQIENDSQPPVFRADGKRLVSKKRLAPKKCEGDAVAPIPAVPVTRRSCRNPSTVRVSMVPTVRP